MVFHAFSFSLSSYQEQCCAAPLRIPWLTHETYSSQNVSFRGFPHQTTSPPAPHQFRVFFTRLGISQLCCSSVLHTSFFVARRFFVFFPCLKDVFQKCLLQVLLYFARCFFSCWCSAWFYCFFHRTHPLSCSSLQPQIEQSQGVSSDGKQEIRFLCTPIHCLDALNFSPFSRYQHRADGLWTASFLALNPHPSCFTRHCGLRHDDNSQSNFCRLMLHWQLQKPWICRFWKKMRP